MNREKQKVHQFKKRAHALDEHHLTPRSRGGESIESNLSNLDLYRHDAWHLLFGDLTLDEIIMLLQRFKQVKNDKRFQTKL